MAVVWELKGGRMRTFNVVVERDPDTGLYVGHVPGWPGAHSQGATLDELRQNLHEVVEMLLEDGEPKLEAEFVGVQVIQVA
jgi:predicted RNase H-like HicB family nuclease